MSDNPLVLVVDDDEDLVKLLDAILTGGGYRTQTATRGKGALAWLEGNQPDLVLLDIMMPDIDGFALLRELRSRASGGKMPVVMITAYTRPHLHDENVQAGAHSLLQKPLRPQALLDHVHKLLHPSE